VVTAATVVVLQVGMELVVVRQILDRWS